MGRHCQQFIKIWHYSTHSHPSAQLVIHATHAAARNHSGGHHARLDAPAAGALAVVLGVGVPDVYTKHNKKYTCGELGHCTCSCGPSCACLAHRHQNHRRHSLS